LRLRAANLIAEAYYRVPMVVKFRSATPFLAQIGNRSFLRTQALRSANGSKGAIALILAGCYELSHSIEQFSLRLIMTVRAAAVNSPP
jgi:hypothetical protein